MKTPIPWGRLGVEFLVIVIGVLVALGVDQWVQGLDDRRLVEETMRALAAEIAVNTGTLERRSQYHDEILPGLAESQRAVESGERRRISISEALPNGLGLYPLRRTAWDMASVTGAVQHFDLSTLSTLSLTYSTQAALQERDYIVSNGIIQPEFFGPVDQSGPIIYLAVMLRDIRGNEDELGRVYAAALRLLREELGDPGAGAVIEVS